jgi:hypothetical protein
MDNTHQYGDEDDDYEDDDQQQMQSTFNPMSVEQSVSNE